jgi:inner membrane protein
LDNLTHTLVGLIMARAGLGRTTPRGVGMLILAANAPDVDVIAWSGRTLAFLDYHRGYTHALASAPVLALLPMLLVKAKFGWRAYVASLLGVLSHLALDWTNVYGIRLLLPFSARWLRLDITDVVDPWIWTVLLLASLAPMIASLASVGSGVKPTVERRAGARFGAKLAWAWFALLALLSYEGARYVLHHRAVAVLSAATYGGAPARRITAVPNRFNPLQWRGIVEGEGFVQIVPLDLRAPFDPAAGQIDYVMPSSPAIEAARKTRAFEVLERFDQLPFWKSAPLADATRVELIDMRFGTPENPGLAAEAIVDASGTVLESQLGFGPPR